MMIAVYPEVYIIIIIGLSHAIHSVLIIKCYDTVIPTITTFIFLVYRMAGNFSGVLIFVESQRKPSE
jgi:hypothetical protein